ncbi:GIY-YIG nuclease family protein [Paucihalobacter ruber]|uniref:GIY-YIG nuclease family protein n=2 Tax=Paucihalobacter ruber TaxID=2567861 RepID=A0A506PLT0_9FLAO|nr:GIY-YIG nuclease family protein [Paucihalobacter ruber]TPV34077.1 GIY-YIG nuclease family protein [Paucihalobacter ruber]
MKYYVYVLESTKDGRLYKGHTNRLEERLKEHNSGKTSSTKGYRPWVLVYHEEYDSEREAIEREKYFKTGSGREYLKNKIRPRGAIEYLPAGPPDRQAGRQGASEL